MKIFISWSGNVSRYVAEGLKEWLRDVNHSLNPWVSSRDIQAGSPWWITIAKELRDTNFGVICVTRSNLTAPWLLFEAGALAKQVEVTPSGCIGDHSTVCPYLIGDLRPADLPKENPLSQFQHTEGTEAGTLFLLKSINSALSRAEPNNAYADDAQLERVFGHWWPDLADRLNHLPPDDEGIAAPTRRSQQEIVEETLDLVRALVRTSHLDKQELQRELPGLRDFIRSRRAALAGFMEQGALLALRGDVLTVIPNTEIYVRYLTDNLKVIGGLASEFYGKSIKVQITAPAEKPF